MTFLLRAIAALELLSAMLCGLLIVYLVITGPSPSRSLTGHFVILGFLILTLPLLTYAGLHLLRLRERGRVASIALMGGFALLSVGLIVAAGAVRANQVVRLMIEVVSILILGSARARRTMRASSSESTSGATPAGGGT